VLQQQCERIAAASYCFVVKAPILGEVIEQDDRIIRPWWIHSLERAIHDVAVQYVEKQITRDKRQYDDEYCFAISQQGTTLFLFSRAAYYPDCPNLSCIAEYIPSVTGVGTRKR
jgi:hypothetical protein